jgi:hypothetical protein
MASRKVFNTFSAAGRSAWWNKGTVMREMSLNESTALYFPDIKSRLEPSEATYYYY